MLIRFWRTTHYSNEPFEPFELFDADLFEAERFDDFRLYELVRTENELKREFHFWKTKKNSKNLSVI